MKINAITKHTNFKGTYFLTCDNHSKPVASIGLFQKIEQDTKDKRNCIYIDNGDFFTGMEPLMTDIYTTFADRNKNIKPVFNLGNAEAFFIKNPSQNFFDCISRLTNSGITLICAPIKYVCQKVGTDEKLFKDIKPYALVQDEIDGKKEDVLVVGTVDIRNSDVLNVDEQSKIVADAIKTGKEETGAKKVVLVSHNGIEDTKKILDNLSNIGIDDIKLVSGGHSHKIEDEEYRGARILHPAPQGKSAYKVESDIDGFHMQKVEYDKLNRYDYSLQGKQENNDIIDNLSIDIENIDPQYHKIIKDTDLLEEICVAKTQIKNRIPGFKTSRPSEMGTMLANKLKDKTGADLSVVLSQDMRGELPEIGEKIYKYQVFDVVNTDKKVWILNVNKEELFDIFNVSLKKQHDGVANSDFLEHSSNILIERYEDVEDEDVTDVARDGFKVGKPTKNRVKEIYLKEDGKWAPVSQMGDRKFSIATCSFIAKSGRASLSYFKNIEDKREFEPTLMTRELFVEALKEAQTL